MVGNDQIRLLTTTTKSKYFFRKTCYFCISNAKTKWHIGYCESRKSFAHGCVALTIPAYRQVLIASSTIRKT